MGSLFVFSLTGHSLLCGNRDDFGAPLNNIMGTFSHRRHIICQPVQFFDQQVWTAPDHVETFAMPCWRPMLGSGIRYGEASHPGPSSELGFCIVNPTSLNNKEDILWDLVSSTSSHFIALSETGATQFMQNKFSAAVRKHRFRTCWSVPVKPHRSTTTIKDCKKGIASGVALSTCHTCRYRHEIVPDKWLMSSRY